MTSPKTKKTKAQRIIAVIGFLGLAWTGEPWATDETRLGFSLVFVVVALTIITVEQIHNYALAVSAEEDAA